MGTRAKAGRTSSRSRMRRTRRVLDRHGRPAPMVTVRDMSKRTATLLRDIDRYGAVAIGKSGKPVAVAIAADHFVSLCIDYSLASIRGLRNK